MTDPNFIEGRPALLPRISGRDWIVGLHPIGLDPAHPYSLRYTVADRWGDAFDLLN